MKERSDGTFRLRLRSYSGMTIDLIDEDDLASCRAPGRPPHSPASQPIRVPRHGLGAGPQMGT